MQLMPRPLPRWQRRLRLPAPPLRAALPRPTAHYLCCRAGQRSPRGSSGSARRGGRYQWGRRRDINARGSGRRSLWPPFSRRTSPWASIATRTGRQWDGWYPLSGPTGKQLPPVRRSALRSRLAARDSTTDGFHKPAGERGAIRAATTPTPPLNRSQTMRGPLPGITPRAGDFALTCESFSRRASHCACAASGQRSPIALIHEACAALPRGQLQDHR